MNIKKALAIFLPITILTVILVPFLSIYVHYYVGYRNVHFELYVSDIQPNEMGKEEFLEDFMYLYNFIKDNHPFIYVKERMLGYNWLDFKDYYLARINACNTTDDFLEVIIDAVTALQNQHTHILSPFDAREYRNGILEYDVYPDKEVFNLEVVDANQYWKYRYWDVMTIRESYLYNILMVYDKGEYIVYDGWQSVLDNYNLSLGSEVIAVDNIPIHDAVKNSIERSYLFYDFTRNRSYIQYLTPGNLGLTPTFTFKNTTGEIINATLYSDSTIFYDNINWRGYYPDLPVVSNLMYPSAKVGYMQIGEMSHDPAAYIDQMMMFYDQIADYDYLIIDIRGNYGGNDYFWYENVVQPLLKEKLKSKLFLAFKKDGTFSHYYRKAKKIYFKKSKSSFDYLPPEVLTDEYDLYKEVPLVYEPANTVDFKGKIAVLIDKCVYSSAESFTIFCKNTGFATLYGTNSGGDGIGRQVYWVLPHSKLILCYSFALGLFESGYSNEEIHTAPDVYYESAADDFSELIDFTIADLTS
ncbi:MAG: hypothetical protein FK730_10950 [Asgard group archaeon]|nr:hypothetical protein [Asgard group archaeon]